MIDSGVVDLVVGIIFVFLVFSLVVSGVNEAITGLVEWRSRHLWRSLRQLLDGDGTKLTTDQRPRAKKLPVYERSTSARLSLTDQLYVHPLIRQLEGRLATDRSRLSRIPAADFSRALIDLFVPNESGEASLEQVRDRVMALSADPRSGSRYWP